MGPIQIYIFGDLDFAYFILNGITMMYANDSTFIKAGFVLSLLFLLWSFIKWSMNPEKNTYPVREWAFGLIFFLIFGGTNISPKVDVQLYSANTPGLFKSTITDVPVIAAVPSWLATNLFYSITKVIHETGALVMPGYERFRGTGIIDKPDADPLNALVRMNTYTASSTLAPEMETAIKNYIEQCYLPYMAYKATAPKLTFMKKHMDETIWQELDVDNEYLDITTLNPIDSTTITERCIENHSRIGALITPDTTGAITELAGIKLAGKGVSPDEVKYGYQIIQEQLTGSPGSPNPYTIMTNMFLARSLKDTLSNSPSAASMQTWAEKMVFEGERKRTFEAAGESRLFMKIYIPTITAIETFSFYIAPILMIFSILGGYGFSFIGKYLTLVIFINLWSFIKAFVDIFTMLALTKAFPPSMGTADGLKENLSVMNFPHTIGEIESMLTIASNLTMAIPVFAMFLLYGGVHSVMGVMRTITGGNVDSANMAPTMSSTMNAGVYNMGDTGTSLTVSTGDFAKTHTSGSNVVFGNQTAGSDISGSYQNASATLKAQQESATQNYNKALSAALSSTKLSSVGDTQTDGENASSSAGFQQLTSTTDQSVRSASSGRSKDFQVAAQLIAGAALNAAVGGSSGSSTKEKPETPGSDPRSLVKSRLMSVGLDANLAAQFTDGMSTKDVQALNDLYSTTKTNAVNASSQQGFDNSYAIAKMKQFTDSVQDNKALTDVSTLGQQIANLKTTEHRLGDSIGGAQALSANNSLEFHRAQPSFDMKAFTDFYNTLGQADKERIGTLLDTEKPPMNANDVAHKVQEITGLGTQAYNGAVISSNVLSLLHKQDKNLETTSTDFALASKFYNTLADHAGSDYGQGFKMAARYSAEMSSTTANVRNAGEDIKEPSVDKAQNVEDAIKDAKFSAPSNQTDPNHARSHAASGTIGSDGNPVKLAPDTGRLTPMSPEQVTSIQQQLKAEDKKMESAQALMTPLNAVQEGFFQAVGDVRQLFNGRDARWGQDAPEISNNLAGYAAKELGVQSGSIAGGLTTLAQASQTHSINQLFTDLNSNDPSVKFAAAQQISSMNDAVTFLSTKEGASAIFKAYDQETGERLIQNAKQFKEYLGARTTGETRFNEDFFNAVSRSRMSGAITDDGASIAMRSIAYMNTGHEMPGASPTGAGALESDAKALSWTLNSSQSTFRDSADAAVISESIKGRGSFIENSAPAAQADSYKKDALHDFIYDTHKQSIVAGVMTSDNQFVPGYNAKDDTTNINQAPLNYVRGIVTNTDDVAEFNSSAINKSIGVEKTWLQNLFGMSQQTMFDQQEAVFVNSTAPTEYATRLQNAGFSNESERIEEGVQDLKEQAKVYNIAIDKQELKQNFVEANEKVNSLPSISEITQKK